MRLERRMLNRCVGRVQLVLLLPCAALAAGNCLSHCDNPCDQLNGNLQDECGGCDAQVGCWPGAEGWRTMSVVVGSTGSSAPTHAQAEQQGSRCPFSPEALSAAAARVGQPLRRAPRVYLYSEERVRRLLGGLGDAGVEAWAFGERTELADGSPLWPVAASQQHKMWALPAIFLHRLWSVPALRASTAAEADLFVIPLFPELPQYEAWHRPGQEARTFADAEREHAEMRAADAEKRAVWSWQPEYRVRAMQKICERLFASELTAAYPHLNERTAPRHVVLAVEYTPIAGYCNGTFESGTRRADAGGGSASVRPLRPPSLHLLERMQWIGHEDFGAYLNQAARTGGRSRVPLPGSDCGGLGINVPFPSVLHAPMPAPAMTPTAEATAAGAPMEPTEPAEPTEPTEPAADDARRVAQRAASMGRTYWMSFAGSLTGEQRGAALRREVWRQCEALGRPSCAGLTSDAGLAFDFKLSEAFELKQRSVFCVEPGGFSPVRKAILDAYAFGCLPVLFLSPEEEAMLWPWHWGRWGADAAVVVDRRAFLRGEVDLVRLLLAIPLPRLRRMRAVATAHLSRLMYHVNTTASVSDGSQPKVSRTACGGATATAQPIHAAQIGASNAPCEVNSREGDALEVLIHGLVQTADALDELEESRRVGEGADRTHSAEDMGTVSMEHAET